MKKQNVTNLKRHAGNLNSVSSFLTIPNAFRQCTVPLPIIHSAIPRLLREILLDSSLIDDFLDMVRRRNIYEKTP